MVQLKPITKENLDAVLALKVDDSQAGFVSTTAESLAQAYVYMKTAFPFAVYDGHTIVGFIMMGYFEEKEYYTLWKLLIDRKYQNRGYGKAALKLGIGFLTDRFHIKTIYTGVIPENIAAKGLYQSVGFEGTGLFENGMEEMCLKCGERRVDDPGKKPSEETDMKLRNMTGIYLSCKGQMLLLYRQGGRVVSNQWIASAGGHFENEELNDPKACVLRELREELHLSEEDLTDMKMRYIGLRNINGEIRQNYYFFANLKPDHYEFFTSNEGKCKWVDYADIMNYDMPLTARYVMAHYLQTGRYTDCLYSAVSDGKGFQFVPLAEG